MMAKVSNLSEYRNDVAEALGQADEAIEFANRCGGRSQKGRLCKRVEEQNVSERGRGRGRGGGRERTRERGRREEGGGERAAARLRERERETWRGLS